MTDKTNENGAPQQLKIIKAESYLPLKIAIGVLLIFALLLFVKVMLGDNSSSQEAEQLAYSNKYCKVIKPAGWTAEVIGDSFVFIKKTEDSERPFDGLIIMDISIDEHNRYSPIDLNPVFVESKIRRVLERYNLNPEKLKVTTVNSDKLYWFISSEDFDFSFTGYKGDGQICYSREVKYIYLGIYPEDSEDNAIKYITKSYQNYLKFPAPYNESDFERPIINTALDIDYLSLEKSGEEKLNLARRYWDMRRLNPSYTVKSLEYFNEAFKCFAMASEEDVIISDDVSAIYKECQALRDRQLGQLKMEILKYYHLNDYNTALDRTNKLLSSLSVNSESSIREWAKGVKVKLEEKSKKSE